MNFNESKFNYCYTLDLIVLYLITNQLQGITNKQTLQDPEMNRVNLGPVYMELGDPR